MALCACGRSDSVGEMASDAISDVETEASEMFSGDNNGKVNDGDGYIGNESTSENSDNYNDSSLNNNDSSENTDNTNSTNNDMM